MRGAVFGDRFSWEDYGAVMNYVRIKPPVVKTNYVDIAGGDSSIDLTEAVGGVSYEDGNLEFKFTLFDRVKADQMKDDLHGIRHRIVLDQDPEYYYEGRVTCTDFSRVKGEIYELQFTARVSPYKRERTESRHVTYVDGEKEILLQNDRMVVMPVVSVAGDITLQYEGGAYQMETGVYQFPELSLRDGLNKVLLSGKGTVEFRYRRGRLI